MSDKQKKFYITTPIYYVNDKPHIGHTYTTVAADVLARHHRMTGNKTFFLTGTDEHGAKIEEKAKQTGLEPKKFVDSIAAKFQFTWDELNISNDNFIRTTDEAHIEAVQKALRHMYEKGDIYKGTHNGLYCRECEQFKTERDLDNGLCPDHRVTPEKVEEESYMFKLSNYKDEILKKIKNDEFKIRPIERRNEIVSFYEHEGLNDISFSRKNVAWGIPIPWDKEHTAYVWADAFLNYLTGLGWNGDEASAKEWWPADVHLMSKDILRVHATIWPAMLLSLDLPLPKQLFIHGFFLIDGQKMSKSLGNVIAPEDLVGRYGVDGARYLLMSATTFGRDGDISQDKFDEKYNADLANGLGNLVARVVSMTEKYFDNKIPSNKGSEKVLLASELLQRCSVITEYGAKLKVEEWIIPQIVNYRVNFQKLFIDKALNEINRIARVLDGYISYYKPFKLIKEDKEKTAAVLYNCLESIRIIALMAWPFMPDTAEKIWEKLGLDSAEEMKKDFKEAIKWGGLETGVKVKKGDPLFPRL